MNRDEAVWYYRLGGQTLGPVSWGEIEALTRDTIDAGELMVARGGDPGWTKAAEVATTNPELAPAAAPTAPAAPAAPSVADADWSAFEEPETEPEATDIPWATPEPSGAAADVLGTAATQRDTGHARVTVAGPRPSYPGGMAAKPGLGGWIGQAWEMVSGDLAAFILGVLLVAIVSVATLFICAPPLQAGLFIMALKKFRGEPISAGTVFEGFQFFWPAWGLALIQGILGAVVGGILGGILGAGLGAAGVDQEVIALAGQFVGSIVGLVIGAAFFFSWVLLVDRGMGPIDSIKNSWAVTGEELISYVGIVFVLQLIAMAGAIACGLGVLITVPMVICATVAAYMWRFRSL